MAERAALAPNLSGLALHKTRPVGMEQEEDGGAQKAPPWKDGLPPEVWRLIVEFSHLGRDVSEIAPTCDRLADVCKVAANAPWGSKGDACGEYGWLYDRANALLGFYRDCNNWHEFSQWAQQNILNYQNTPTWYTNPRVYFKRCCFEFNNRILSYGDNLRNAQSDLIRMCHPINRPWTRAFHAYLIRRDPSLFANLNSRHSIFNPQHPYLKVDYTYYAKVALARDGRMLKHIPGAFLWIRIFSTNVVKPAVMGPSDGFTPEEFVALAQIAINSSQFSSGAANVEIFSRVPLPLRRQLFSDQQIEQLAERFDNMEMPMDA